MIFLLITPADFCGECPNWLISEDVEECNGIVMRRCEFLNKFLPASYVCDYLFDPEDEPSMEPPEIDNETQVRVIETLAELGIIRFN